MRFLPGLVAGDRQRRVLEAKAQQRGISYAEMERTAFSYTSIKEYVTPDQLADQIRLHVQSARQDDFRAGDLDLRRYADAGIGVAKMQR